MRTLTTDILVIGSGGAGLRAALSAREAAPQLSVTVISRGAPGGDGVTAVACSDRMAFHVSFPFTEPGGEAAWTEHARDIYEGGRFVSDPNLADLLARESALAYRRLAEIGVPFACGAKNRPRQFLTDGSRFARACYTGPYTARDIEHALLAAVKRTDINLLGDSSLISILVDPDRKRVAGVLCLSGQGGEWLAIGARSIILACGGPGRIFDQNVYPPGMDALPWFAALRAGATLVNIEFIQFGLSSTATSLACSGSLMRAFPRIGADGRDLLADVQRIAPDRDPIELLFMKGASWPVSAESPARAVDIAAWRATSRGETVTLDYRANPDFVDTAYIGRRLPEVVRAWFENRGILLTGNGSISTPIERLAKINPLVIDWFALRDIDLASQPIEVRHAAQHFQGGVLIDTKAQTRVAGLYACGEVAGGQHGANRPGGNALLDCQVMGHVAGNEAAAFASTAEPVELVDLANSESARLAAEFQHAPGLEPDECLQNVAKILSRFIGPIRTSDGLTEAETILHALLETRIDAEKSGLHRAISAKAAVVAGLAVARAAIKRPESRGSHLYFEDEDSVTPLPANEPAGRVWNAITWDGRDVLVKTLPIPTRSESGS